MGALFNFELSERKPLSKLCHYKKCSSFLEACKYVKQLPYGRNSNKVDLALVLTEQKGTCSTKHAFLAQLLKENDQFNIKLHIGIYAMDETNTKGIGSVLQTHNLEYIPEAHTYLKHGNTVLDYTSTQPATFENYLLHEEIISPEDIAEYKITMHQDYIQSWIAKNAIPYSLDELWKIREQCISNLSK